MRILLSAALALLAAAPASAENITLERIFASPDLSGPVPREAKLSPDGRYATLLKPRANDRERFDLWAIDTETGEERMLVDSEALGTGAELSEDERMRRERARIGSLKGIVAYDWAPDSESILVPLDGDLYLADLAGNVRRLTETDATELDAKVSPGGTYVSYVVDGTLYAIDLASGETRQLSPRGTGTVSYGVAEFVAQEEMGRNTGYWWSPDDSRIAFTRVDESPVEVVTRTAIGAEGTRTYEQRYPAAGTPNAVVELFVKPVSGGEAAQVELYPDADRYLARAKWTGPETLIVQTQPRDQSAIFYNIVDAASGLSEVAFQEEAEAWTNLSDRLCPVGPNRAFITSEESGFRHVYFASEDEMVPLTSGSWQVSEIEACSDDGRIYFTGNRDTPLERHLYVIEADTLRMTATEPVRLTEQGYWNEVEMDEEGTRAIITRSSPTQPPQTYIQAPGTAERTWLTQNVLGADHPYAPYAASHTAPRFGTVTAADGTALLYKMLLPNLAEGERAPVFVQVYGGPGAGRQVTRQWDSRTGLIHQWLVDQGWIVFSVDGRGSPDRGKAFEDHIHRAMGTVEVGDQLTALDWLKQQDFVDPERIAVYGWSYGGYMTLKLLEAAPGAYAAGISGAPVTDWTLYDTHYTERYLGDPNAAPEVYESAGAIANADKIEDPLLLIHGMADDNVVFQNATVLMGELQSAGVPFDMMVYPGATHRVSGEGREVHVWRTIQRFLQREVLGLDAP